MNTPHDKFCVLPWVSLEASPIGTVRPCCLAQDEIVDSNSVKFNLKTANFDDIRNSEYMYQLRQAFLAGERPATCNRCWAEESAGRTSKRMHTLERLKHIVNDTEWDHDAKPLMFLDLKLGNICNLKCRICGSWSSSSFATEELQALPKERQRESFHYQMLRAGAWPRGSEEFWKQLESGMSEIRYIEFTGGEPFMIREHFDLLSRLVASGHANNIEIHYNTNGTHFPDSAEEIWSNFKHVEIAFSIDDVGERFEYQRSGAKWNEVNHNIFQFRNMRDRNLNMTLQVCCTVNVFNVCYLEDVATWIQQQDFDFIYWNILHDAPQFSIASLPGEVKKIVANYLDRCRVPGQFRSEFDRIKDFMLQGNSTTGDLLRQEITRVDQRRGEQLKLVAPELAQLLGL